MSKPHSKLVYQPNDTSAIESHEGWVISYGLKKEGSKGFRVIATAIDPDGRVYKVELSEEYSGIDMSKPRAAVWDAIDALVPGPSYHVNE